MILLIDLYFEFKNFQQKHAEHVATVELKQKNLSLKVCLKVFLFIARRKFMKTYNST